MPPQLIELTVGSSAKQKKPSILVYDSIVSGIIALEEAFQRPVLYQQILVLGQICYWYYLVILGLWNQMVYECHDTWY
jgi:hypothetical protein